MRCACPQCIPRIDSDADRMGSDGFPGCGPVGWDCWLLDTARYWIPVYIECRCKWPWIGFCFIPQKCKLRLNVRNYHYHIGLSRILTAICARVCVCVWQKQAHVSALIEWIYAELLSLSVSISCASCLALAPARSDGWSCQSSSVQRLPSRSRTGGHPIWLLSYSLWHAGSDSGIPLHCELSRKLQLECVLAITGRIFHALFVTLGYFFFFWAPGWVCVCVRFFGVCLCADEELWQHGIVGESILYAAIRSDLAVACPTTVTLRCPLTCLPGF